MTSKNLYHRRLVAEAGAKACWVCHKPAATVLITPEQDDWFHVCAGHLADRQFAVPRDAEAWAERQRRERLEREIEAVKREFEEKRRAKLARRKQKEHEKTKGEDKKKKEEETEDDQDEKEKEERLTALEKKKEKEPDKAAAAAAAADGPRIFELQKNFYQMRLQKKRDAETAKRNRERLRAPGTFPSVPSGDL